MADRDDLAEAREQFKLGDEALFDNREAALSDIRFARLGEQWDEKIKSQRERDLRPCLTINRLPAFARQVVNDCRQNKPAIHVLPASDKSDVQTANVITGLVRHIEASSDADVSYDTGVECAVYGGYGFWRVDVDYTYDDAFDLDIGIRRIANPFTVVFDDQSTAADSSDWDYAFVTELLKEEEFKRKYKGADMLSFDEVGKDENWRTGNDVRVAEWWRREKTKRNIVQLSDGSVMAADQYLKAKQLFDMAGLTVKGEREADSKKVTQKLISGAQVLDKKQWHGCYIPIIPVFGDEVNVEGKRHFRSLIRDARDPQKMFNYWRTAATELVALAPRVPFIGPRGAFTTDAEKWDTTNTHSHAYVEYDGPIAPARQPLDSGVAAGALQEALSASDDMKSIMGIFDAALGARSNETSGIAIQSRQRESDVSTFHFIDNLNRAVRHTGRVLLDLIPQIYTGQRIIRILGEDGTPSNVQLGEQQGQPQMPQQQPMPGQPGMPPQAGQPGIEGMHKVYDLQVGKYDVVVKAGPSFGTRREEAAQQQIMTMQAVPQLAPLMIDILASNLDWPQADKLKERIEKQMANPPPPEEMVKAQATAMLEQAKAQSTAQLEQMRAAAEADKAQRLGQIELEKARQQSLIKMQETARDNQAKESIERAKIESNERIAQMKIDADRANKLLELSAGIIAARAAAKGPNLAGGSNLDQSGAAQPEKADLSSVQSDIESMLGRVESGEDINGEPKKPSVVHISRNADGDWEAEDVVNKKRARFRRGEDGSWEAESQDDEPGTSQVSDSVG